MEYHSVRNKYLIVFPSLIFLVKKDKMDANFRFASKQKYNIIIHFEYN